MSLSIRQPQLGLYNFSLIGPNLVFKMTSKGKVCVYIDTERKGWERWEGWGGEEKESSRGNIRKTERGSTN